MLANRCRLVKLVSCVLVAPAVALAMSILPVFDISPGAIPAFVSIFGLSSSMPTVTVCRNDRMAEQFLNESCNRFEWWNKTEIA